MLECNPERTCMSIQIDRCICFQKSFAELRQIAKTQGADSVSALQEHVIFGRKCRLCHPYVAEMLRSGQTVFHQLLPPSEPELS